MSWEDFYLERLAFCGTSMLGILFCQLIPSDGRGVETREKIGESDYCTRYCPQIIFISKMPIDYVLNNVQYRPYV